MKRQPPRGRRRTTSAEKIALAELAALREDLHAAKREIVAAMQNNDVAIFDRLRHLEHLARSDRSDLQHAVQSMVIDVSAAIMEALEQRIAKAAVEFAKAAT